MIELDVQISKDKIPIIIHDFSAKVFLKKVKIFVKIFSFIIQMIIQEVISFYYSIFQCKKSDKDFDAMAIPVKDITFHQMSDVCAIHT
jgi:glycerophosphoryl diester phosphodiesterase